MPYLTGSLTVDLYTNGRFMQIVVHETVLYVNVCILPS